MTDREKLVILLIDEVCTAHRVEFTNGRLVGLTEDGKKYKTVLVFMVQAVASKYNGIVMLCPVDGLTAELLQKYFMCVLKQLCQILHVIGGSVDNHVVNRTMYKNLCEGTEIKSFIQHPVFKDDVLFLLFDTTHNMKNIFNNWVSTYIFI